MADNWELKQKVDEIHILLERCDAYEARIAELEALVRRVKAESLRVVPVKNENELNFGAFVRHIFLDGKLVRLERWEK